MMRTIFFWNNRCATLLGFLFILNLQAHSQVGIGTTTPYPFAALDIQSTTKGLLIPRMTQSDRANISTPAPGMLVYQTDQDSSFFWYNGVEWLRLTSQKSGWNVTGNSNLNASGHFLGTTDTSPLKFRIKNINAGILDTLLSNTALGFRSLDSITTGNHNAGFGYKTLIRNTDGYGNAALGSNANRNNTTGFYNTAAGFQSLVSNTSGNHNIAIGRLAMALNKTGNGNVAVGNLALYINMDRNHLVAIGDSCLFNNGFQATLPIHATGNTGVGAISLFNNTRGYSNTAVGYNTMKRNTTGFQNVAIGSHALLQNTIGQQNVIVGDSAYYSATGSFNTVLGMAAGLQSSGWYSVLIGNDAGRKNEAWGNVIIGSDAGRENTSGTNNTFVGDNAGTINTTGSSNTVLGAFTAVNNMTGSSNIAIGSLACYNNNSGNQNTGVGTYALIANTSGNNNTSVGFASLYYNTRDNIVALGDSALFYNSYLASLPYESTKNTAVGSQTMFLNTLGYSNTALGFRAMRNNQLGNQNTGVGTNALSQNLTGIQNVAVGDSAAMNTQGNFNTAVGQFALFSNSSQDNNTAIGWHADVLPGIVVDNATAIGSNAKIGSSNGMAFGNSNVESWSFARSNNDPGNALQVGSTPANGNGAYLSAGGTWTNASDENLKQNSRAVDAKDILEKINLLHITQWEYGGTAHRETHIGPMAQQFQQLFGLGIEGNDRSISTIDPAGLALVGIQELKKMNEALSVKVNAQQQLIEDLLQRLNWIETQNNISKKM